MAQRYRDCAARRERYDEGMDKIAMLTEILRQNPADAFARYGLAMAHAAESRSEDALREFAETTEHNPDYVPAYQMAAQELLKLARPNDAKAWLQAGLDACERTGNGHAASEMGAMLSELG
jgi:tetratricopeptide (TPR) repeat protein